MYFLNHLVVFLRYLGDPDKTDILIQSDLVALKTIYYVLNIINFCNNIGFYHYVLEV